jgi:hypothetical protein
MSNSVLPHGFDRDPPVTAPLIAGRSRENSLLAFSA